MEIKRVPTHPGTRNQCTVWRSPPMGSSSPAAALTSKLLLCPIISMLSNRCVHICPIISISIISIPLGVSTSGAPRMGSWCTRTREPGASSRSAGTPRETRWAELNDKRVETHRWHISTSRLGPRLLMELFSCWTWGSKGVRQSSSSLNEQAYRLPSPMYSSIFYLAVLGHVMVPTTGEKRQLRRISRMPCSPKCWIFSCVQLTINHQI